MTSPIPSEPRTRDQLYHVDALAPATAAWLVASCILLIYGFQIVLGIVGAPVLVASLGGDAAALLALFFYCRRHGVRASRVGLRRPERRFVVSAVLVGISAWFLAFVIVNLIHPPGGESATKSLQEVVEQPGLAGTLAAIALLPGITEELVFRGIFMRALARRFVPWFGVVLSALVFAGYHLIPVQIVSTFVLGLVFGFLTLCAESAIPAIIAHVLNNTVVIVISRDSIPVVGSWMGTHAAITLGASVALTGTGLALAARRRA